MKKYFVMALVVALAAFMCAPGAVYTAPCTYDVAATVDTVDFSAVDLASTGTEVVTISNNDNDGYCAAAITFTITGDDADNFSYEAAPSCTSVADFASCTVDVSFTPDVDGEFNAALNVIVGSTTYDTVTLAGTAAATSSSDGDTSGCDASASTGVAGTKAFGPAAMGLFAMLGLVMGTVAIRRRMR